MPRDASIQVIDLGPSASPPRQAGNHLRDRDRRIAELEARVAQQDQQAQLRGLLKSQERWIDISSILQNGADVTLPKTQNSLASGKGEVRRFPFHALL